MSFLSEELGIVAVFLSPKTACDADVKVESIFNVDKPRDCVLKEKKEHEPKMRCSVVSV